MKHKPKQPDRAARNRRKYHTDEYRGWKLRYIIPKPGDRHKTPYWIADNCDKKARKRLAADTRADAVQRVDDEMGELEKHGTAHKIDDNQRAAVKRAETVANGRATLDEIVAFWAERHPVASISSSPTQAPSRARTQGYISPDLPAPAPPL
ncbi:MAG TPA: hypothetical protein P5306_05130 [Kiritimatiellia bacterium]|nr:hypothetical protein [Kiritimatiellia bacterium]